MKFTHETQCSCGGRYVFSAYGDAEFGSAQCSKCSNVAHLTDPLTASIAAERLLLRSRAELIGGDYSLSILIGTMAVESYLTRLFLKFKGMENYARTFSFPTAAQEAAWEVEYPRSGGFSRPIEFVSNNLMGMKFDAFVAINAQATAIFSGLSNTSNTTPARYIQDELFKRRNRIAHWGFVNSNREEAELCHAIAVAAVSILREMDRSKYGSL